MTCPRCHEGKCDECVDVGRFLAGFEKPICQCIRKNHAGEPADQQILDPETGAVHAPGLVVKADGTVTQLGREMMTNLRDRGMQ